MQFDKDRHNRASLSLSLYTNEVAQRLPQSSCTATCGSTCPVQVAYRTKIGKLVYINLYTVFKQYCSTEKCTGAFLVLYFVRMPFLVIPSNHCKQICTYTEYLQLKGWEMVLAKKA